MKKLEQALVIAIFEGFLTLSIAGALIAIQIIMWREVLQ